MDDLYLDNIDEFVNDHDKIVSVRSDGDLSAAFDDIMGYLMLTYWRRYRMYECVHVYLTYVQLKDNIWCPAVVFNVPCGLV